MLFIRFLTCLLWYTWYLSTLSDCCQVHPVSWNHANKVLVERFYLEIRARMLLLHLGHRRVCSTRLRIKWRFTVPMPIAVLLHADLTSFTITSLLAWCVPAACSGKTLELNYLTVCPEERGWHSQYSDCYRLYDRRFDFQARDFLFFKPSRLVLGPT